MKDTIAERVVTARSLAEVRDTLISLFSALRNEGGVGKVGVVAGVIAADGPDFVEQNLKRLAIYTDYIRSRHAFPVFSASDIFLPGIHERFLTGEGSRQYFQFWHDILTANVVTDLFLTPRWNKSENVKAKHQLANELGLTVHYWDIFDLYPEYRK